MALEYTQQNWVSVDDPLDNVTGYSVSEKLKKVGFETNQRLIHRAGQAQLFSLHSGHKFPFSFCCLFHIGGIYDPYYAIYIRGVVNLIDFLKEIDAHTPPEELSIPTIPDVPEYLQGTYFSEAMQTLYLMLNKWKEQDYQVPIKQVSIVPPSPKPVQRRRLSKSLKTNIHDANKQDNT